MSSFVPQALKIIRERDASSVSLRMYFVTVTGFALWALYGALLKSLPLMGSQPARRDEQLQARLRQPSARSGF
jgi:uncharacterized protein with PQ loop repeat